jgi:hypothetical protein
MSYHELLPPRNSLDFDAKLKSTVKRGETKLIKMAENLTATPGHPSFAVAKITDTHVSGIHRERRTKGLSRPRFKVGGEGRDKQNPQTATSTNTL